MHAGAQEGEEGDRGSGDQQASSLMREDKSCRSNHKAENKNFVTLCLLSLETLLILMSFWLDFGCSAVQ